MIHKAKRDVWSAWTLLIRVGARVRYYGMRHALAEWRDWHVLTQYCVVQVVVGARGAVGRRLRQRDAVGVVPAPWRRELRQAGRRGATAGVLWQI